ncbi:MAG: hypothetical protein Kow0032_19920 [Methyloligellaceae bacterium]
MRRGSDLQSGTFLRTLLAAAALCLLVLGLGPGRAAADTRTLTIYNIHTKETAEITFKKDGEFLPEGLKQINHIFRDWRRNEETEIDPELVDLVWQLHRELGSREPVHLISGYRSRKTNESLRRRGGGQASKSRHILGKAADIHFPDVPIKELRNSALVHEVGGVGYYPKSGIPFVHVDTGRIRHWPRLGRQELAALFPHGHTHHVPRDGKPITPADSRRALAALRAKGLPLPHEQRAIRLARLETVPEPDRAGLNGLITASTRKTDTGTAAATRTASSRQHPQPALVTAGASLSALPWLARIGGITGSIPEDRETGTQRPPVRLASLDPGEAIPLLPERNPAAQPLTGRSAMPHVLNPDSPDYDPEHPEELAYAPFPIAALLREEPLARDTVIAGLAAPRHDQAGYLLMQPARALTMPVRPLTGTRNLRLSLEFKAPEQPAGPLQRATPPAAHERVLTASNPAPGRPLPRHGQAAGISGGYGGGSLSGGSGFGFSASPR